MRTIWKVFLVAVGYLTSQVANTGVSATEPKTPPRDRSSQTIRETPRMAPDLSRGQAQPQTKVAIPINPQCLTKKDPVDYLALIYASPASPKQMLSSPENLARFRAAVAKGRWALEAIKRPEYKNRLRQRGVTPAHIEKFEAALEEMEAALKQVKHKR